MIREALNELTEEFREVIVMRDIEGLSYKEIANAADLPIGTVMSRRLARARGKLARSAQRANREGVVTVNCEEARILLHGHLDGELDLVRDLEVERHIEECPRCAREFATLRAMRTRLKDEALSFPTRAARIARTKIRRAARAGTESITRPYPARRGAFVPRARRSSRFRWRLARCWRCSSCRARLVRQETTLSHAKWSRATYVR